MLRINGRDFITGKRNPSLVRIERVPSGQKLRLGANGSQVKPKCKELEGARLL